MRNFKLKSFAILLVFLTVLLALSSCQILCKHSDTEWQTQEEATLHSEGIKNRVCASCGKIIETEAIPELELSESEVIAKLKDTVFKVYSYDYDGKTQIGQGSGFFIDEDGTFLTNAHVVNNAFFLKIETNSGQVYDVDRIYAYNHTDSDYAICRAKGVSSKPVSFSENVELGDTVYALGYPNNAESLVTSSGEITALHAVSKEISYYSSNAPIDNGSSGGILANSKGDVIGMTTCLFTDMTYGSIRYSDIKAALEAEYIDFSTPAETFHTKVTVQLNSTNVSEYFDISIEDKTVGSTVKYSVHLSLKQKYKSEKITMGDSDLEITVSVNVVYEYKAYDGLTLVNKTKTDTGTVYFDLYEDSDMFSISSGDCQSSVDLSDAHGRVYYGASAEFVSAFGKITLFDINVNNN